MSWIASEKIASGRDWNHFMLSRLSEYVSLSDIGRLVQLLARMSTLLGQLPQYAETSLKS
jgi:hypothetical protein